MKKTSFLLLLPVLYVTAFAQPSRAPQIQSPEVHQDRTVTFRFRAPRAENVMLSGQFLTQNAPMTKDTSGNWSVTVGPVSPDLYPYSFIADGIQLADPANPQIFPNERFKSSLLDVTGDKPANYSLENIPHGDVRYKYYYSTTLGLMRPLLVYTPPGYDENTRKQFPVLYLVHGMTDTEETWFKVGKVNLILDNMIAKKQVAPLIVVMPYANPYPDLIKKDKNTKVDLLSTDHFTNELLNEIIPYTEKHFRAMKAADKRAVAGFSLGGRQSLAAGLGHPQTFSYVFAYAPAIFERELAESMTKLYKPAGDLNKHLKLLWLSCGKSDGLYAGSKAFEDLLNQNNIRHQTFYPEGGHTWMNCRLFITETAKLLFK